MCTSFVPRRSKRALEEQREEMRREAEGRERLRQAREQLRQREAVLSEPILTTEDCPDCEKEGDYALV